MRNKPIRVGVIGCGHWGKNYVRTFSTLPGARLEAVADLDDKKLEGTLKSHPNIRVFKDYKKLIASGCCDAVVVATVASTHHQIVRNALEAGLDVLAEKPFTMTIADANDLVKLSEDSKCICMVAHTFLFNPSIRKIKEYLDRGEAGKIYYAKARRTHLGLVREDVNAVWDLAPHDISMFIYLLGESPSSVQAVGRRVLRKNREDAAFVNLQFPSGVIANIAVSWADSNKERYLDIVGSKCRISFDDMNMQEPIRIYYKGITVELPEGEESDFGEFKYLLRDGDILSPKVPVQEPLRVLCESFLHAVNTRERPYSDARFGAQVVEVLVNIDEALKKGRNS